MPGLDELPALVYCLILCVSLSTSLPFMDFGVVYATPGAFRFVGESLELYCNITNIDVRENSSMLHLERITKKDQNIIPLEYIEVLTTKAIRLRMWNLDVDDEGIYTCFQETFSGESRVIGSQVVKIDNKPQRVKDVSCRVYNWEQMRCNWDLGVIFHHAENLKVSLVWTIHGEQQDCPELTNTSCLWDSTVYIHGYQYLMVVEVAVVVDGKELIKTRSPQLKIDTVFFVEPAPVNNLQATVESSTCVYLTWQHSAEDWQKFFVAESRIMGEEKWHHIILNQEQEDKDYQSAVCNLTPFTNYEFRMSVLPFPVETTEPVIQGYKSEWKIVSATTLEDVPTTAPKMCPDCFHEYKCPQETTHSCVRINWQSLKENEKHGILTNYNITYVSLETGERQTFLLPVTEARSLQSVDLELPNHNQSFKITVIPATGQGFSKRSSSLIVPSAQRRPNPPQNFLVEWDEFDYDTSMRFYLSWAALNVDAKTGLKYTNVSVVWCCGSGLETVCQSDINWIKLPADQVTYELQPGEDECYFGNFLIGIASEVSLDGHLISSGIHWSSCVYLRNQKPQISPKNVHQSSVHPSNGLTIQWDRLDCMEERSFITEHLVRYCPLDEDNSCLEAEKSLNVSNTLHEVTLTNLLPDVRYRVSVIAVSSAGLGPFDPFITHAVKGSSLPEPEIERATGIIVGIISFGIFLILTLVLWRYCFYWRKTAPHIDNLIQTYGQSSENYSDKKLQDFRNRPLPKTPEDQHFYGSSACMNIHGSDAKKKSRHSESCSEDSITSQTNLLLNLVQISPPRSRNRPKKDGENKVSKPTNVSYKTDSSRIALSLSRTSDEIQYNSSDNSSEITEFSKADTLSVHRPNMERPTYLSLNEQHTVDPFSFSALKNHKSVECTNCTSKYSVPLYKYQSPPQACIKSTTDKLQKSQFQNYAPMSGYTTSDFMDHSHSGISKASLPAWSSSTLDNKEIKESPETKRHSVPLESLLSFAPPPTSSPPSPCPKEEQFISRLTSLPYCTSSELSLCSKFPFSTHTNLFGNSGHSKHDSFMTTMPAVTQTVDSASPSMTHNNHRAAESSFTQSPTCSATTYTDYLQLARSLSHEERRDVLDISQFSPSILSSYTFPRNGCTLQLPSPLTRPLSGDLLDLPPAYYEDPLLGGSNQILTEL